MTSAEAVETVPKWDAAPPALVVDFIAAWNSEALFGSNPTMLWISAVDLTW